MFLTHLMFHAVMIMHTTARIHACMHGVYFRVPRHRRSFLAEILQAAVRRGSFRFHSICAVHATTNAQRNANSRTQLILNTNTGFWTLMEITETTLVLSSRTVAGMYARIANNTSPTPYQAWTQSKVLQGDVAAAAEYIWTRSVFFNCFLLMFILFFYPGSIFLETYQTCDRGNHLGSMQLKMRVC